MNLDLQKKYRKMLIYFCYESNVILVIRKHLSIRESNEDSKRFVFKISSANNTSLFIQKAAI